MNRLKKLINFYILKQKLNRKNSKLYSIHVDYKTEFGKFNTIGKKVYIGENVCIGDYSYINSGAESVLIESNVSIGSFCSIAPGVIIAQGNHPTNYITTHPILYDTFYGLNEKNNMLKGLPDEKLHTKIGNDVWIGSRAWIKRGIEIGDGSVIAANAVVVRDVEPYSIVGGVPATFKKYRFNYTIVEELLKINRPFWYWETEELKNNFHLLYDVESYIEYCSQINKKGREMG